jgi:hypothetical protein
VREVTAAYQDIADPLGFITGFSRAFHRVPHDRLLPKIGSLGVGSRVVNGYGGVPSGPCTES